MFQASGLSRRSVLRICCDETITVGNLFRLRRSWLYIVAAQLLATERPQRHNGDCVHVPSITVQ